jgi:hypothetical protein
MQQVYGAAKVGPSQAILEAERARALAGYAFALLLGLSLVYHVFPLDFLLGTVDQIGPAPEDIAQNIIVQRYFFADTWRWPLLNAVNLVGPEGTNIGLIDGIPLIALPLKLLEPLLPPAFHGVNLWHALAWLLQPVTAVWCLRGAGERRFLPAVAVAVAAASMPVWWNRFGHPSLTGHFLVLLALGTYLRLVRRQSMGMWLGAVAIEVAALLTQPYLAVMTLAVYSAVPLTLLFRRDRGWIGAAIGVVVAAGALVAGLWALDYLGVTGGVGFGEFKMDLLSPIWPEGSALFPWRVPAIGAWEGYNYLGAGLLLGILAAALLRPAATLELLVRHAGLAFVLLGLAVYALSQRPTVAGHPIADLGFVPDWLENLRSTGRFFWPVAYALLLGVVLLLARVPTPRLAAALLVAVAALQFADASRLREGLRTSLMQPRPAWTVDAPGLRQLLAHASSVTLLPSWYCVPVKGFEPEQDLLLQVLLLASETAVPASTMDVPRHHGNLRCTDKRLAAAPLGRGEVRVLTPAARDAYLPLVPRAAELCRPMGKVVACYDPSAIGPAPTELPLPLSLGEARFSPTAAGLAFLGPGWSFPEEDGVWTDRSRALIRFRRPPELVESLRLTLHVVAFAPADGATQNVELWSDGRLLGQWILPDRVGQRLEVELPPGPPGPMALDLRVAQPTSPVARGLDKTDDRALGLQIQGMEVALASGSDLRPLPPLAAGEVPVASGAPGLAFLGRGWSDAEADGVWSDGPKAEIRAERPPELAGPLRLAFTARGFAPGDGQDQRVEVWLFGEKLEGWTLRDREPKEVELDLPAGPPGPIVLEVRVAQPASPVERGLGTDPRKLGLKLEGFRVEPAS